jgi:hypothetical protein
MWIVLNTAPEFKKTGRSSRSCSPTTAACPTWRRRDLAPLLGVVPEFHLQNLQAALRAMASFRVLLYLESAVMQTDVTGFRDARLILTCLSHIRGYACNSNSSNTPCVPYILTQYPRANAV